MFCFKSITLHLYFSLLVDNFDKLLKLHNNQHVKCLSINCRPFMVICIISEYIIVGIYVCTQMNAYIIYAYTHSSSLWGVGE